MQNFKFGIKLFSTNTGLIDQTIQLIDEKIFDYIELFLIPDTQISPFIIDLPYVIHIPHDKFGVNIGEAGKKEYNLQKINEAMTWADELDARYMILHAGDGSMEHAADLIRELADSRLLIENMPKVGLDDENMIGYSPAQIMELIGDSEIGLCLDFGHAIKAAISLKIDFNEMMQGFLMMNPKIFHISDGNFNTEKDEHLNIGAGNYDFKYFKNCIYSSSSKLVTLETPRQNNLSLKDDIKNVDALRLLWDL